MKLTLASTEAITYYWVLAYAWANQQDWRYYEPDRFAATKGVAEFLANQQGETVFESYVGREYNVSN